jgi:hypothetical protein
MMTRVQLEVFPLSAPTPASDIVVLGKVELEETRLAAFDKGYVAGWDDATVAAQSDRTKAEDEVARNLQALGFTFQEARMHLLRGLRPLLTTMMGRLLPDMGRAVLMDLILETILPRAEEALSAPVRLHINPRTRPYVEMLAVSAKGLSLRIVEDPDLVEGQVFMRFESGEETLVDIDRLVNQILNTVRNFFNQAEQERKHG